ncbi:MAG: methyltransferase domain-containing protein [Candidatus Lambdaproteobacteria bacterium]|nr:methyltransferase domain-containing protein [Candidatus Lambdaproteobacteria bacterium]
MSTPRLRKRPARPDPSTAAPRHGVSAVRQAVVRDYLAFERGAELSQEAPATVTHEPDRRLYLHLLHGMVRHKRYLEAELARLSARSRSTPAAVVRTLALLGLYQLRFLERVPAHAAVFETVGLAPAFGHARAKGWLNGILRSAAREAATAEEARATLPLAVRTSHPDWMVERWSARFGEARTRALCEDNNRHGGATVRPERGRIGLAALRAQLEAEGVAAHPHPLFAGALRVGHTAALLRAPAFRQGLCTVQDVGSQVLLNWVAPLLEGRVLDVCAAPGGKLTLLAGLRDARLRPVGADLSRAGLVRVRENFARLRLPAVPLLQAEGRRLPFAAATFGAVLLDVPCSATGIIRKAPEVKWRRRPEHLALHAQTQAELMAEAARVLAPGGLILYATCSLEPEENERQVGAFLAARPGFVRVPLGETPAPAGLGLPLRRWLTAEGDFLLLPGAENSGMYGALLRRTRA